MKFTDPNVRPTALRPLYENIPQEMRERDQWVIWRYEWRDRLWTKVPYDPTTLGRARSNDPATWTSFEKACEAHRHAGFDGIGFVFTVNDDYVGIDFDHCLDAEGNIKNQKVKEWIERFDSYTERSVSGTGLHVIVKGVSGPGLNRDNVEIYDRGRYFTFTGHVHA